MKYVVAEYDGLSVSKKFKEVVGIVELETRPNEDDNLYIGDKVYSVCEEVTFVFDENTFETKYGIVKVEDVTKYAKEEIDKILSSEILV